MSYFGRRNAAVAKRQVIVAAPPDAPQIQRIDAACFPDGELSLDGLMEAIRGQRVYAVREGHRLLAYAAAAKDKERPWTIRLEAVAVHPGCRRQGLGRQLVEAVRKKWSGRRLEVLVPETATAIDATPPGSAEKVYLATPAGAFLRSVARSAGGKSEVVRGVYSAPPEDGIRVILPPHDGGECYGARV